MVDGDERKEGNIEQALCCWLGSTIATGAWLIVFSLGRLVVVARRVRSPQRQVVAQQLHDQRRVLVRVLVERIQFGDRIVECLIGTHTHTHTQTRAPR